MNSLNKADKVETSHNLDVGRNKDKSIDWDSVQWDKLTPEEKWRLEHMKMHEKHKGHESMHAEMILILFATLIFSQIALVKWKQVYPSSYHVCTLVGMWSIPLLLSAKKYVDSIYCDMVNIHPCNS